MPLRLRKLRSRATSGDCGSADQHRAARARLDQRHAPQDHRAHHLLAERGFGDQQRVQLLGVDLERVGLADRDAVDEGGPARELAQLAGEVARTVLGHRQLVRRGRRGR